jgi:Spy/CpxP family protein refolding chaperone
MKRQLLFASALVLVPIVAVAGSGLHQRHGHGDAKAHVDEMLDEVDASAAQRQAIEPLVDRTTASAHEIHAQAAELHDELLGILTAETIDRAALESVRAEGVALVDRASREMVAAMTEMAEVLTPEQRKEIAREAESWHR